MNMHFGVGNAVENTGNLGGWGCCLREQCNKNLLQKSDGKLELVLEA
jgi:hypothetical protein